MARLVLKSSCTFLAIKCCQRKKIRKVINRAWSSFKNGCVSATMGFPGKQLWATLRMTYLHNHMGLSWQIIWLEQVCTSMWPCGVVTYCNQVTLYNFEQLWGWHKQTITWDYHVKYLASRALHLHVASWGDHRFVLYTHEPILHKTIHIISWGTSIRCISNNCPQRSVFLTGEAITYNKGASSEFKEQNFVGYSIKVIFFLVHLQLQAAKIDNKNKRKGFFNISTVYHWNGAHHVW